MKWTYESLTEVVRGRGLPLVLVDLERFDTNLHQFTSLAARHGKTVRIASKSLRVPDLLRRTLSVGAPVTRGAMCYSAAEAAYLAESGFDDLLVAYPAVQPADLAAVGRASRAGKTITLMVDSADQAVRLADCWRTLNTPSPLPVCIEFDVSWRLLGLHIGAQRSPLRSLGACAKLLDEILRLPELQLTGVMA
jgi:D-serine deaminase-like pyridoxal phosphate-dependent protein